MTQLDKKIKKVCSFYISDWHLVTMLLPNIDKKINKGITITTITETNLEEKIQTLLDKLRIKNKERILKIDWKAKEINEEIIKNIIKNNDEIIVNKNPKGKTFNEIYNNIINNSKDYQDKEFITDNKENLEALIVADCFIDDMLELEKIEPDVLDKVSIERVYNWNYRQHRYEI